MIQFDLKPCCANCESADIKVSKFEYQYPCTIGDAHTISCSHSAVCYKYIDEPASSKLKFK